MDIVFLNRDNVPANFNQFRHRKELMSPVLEDNQQVHPDFDFTPELLSPFIRYIGVVVEQQIEGLFKLIMIGGCLWDAHVALAPELRGKIGVSAARKGIAMMKSEFGQHTKIVLNIPTCNRPSLAFAYATGFRKTGMIHNAFLKHGRLHHRVLLELPNE